MIRTTDETVSTRLTVLNYDKYQESRNGSYHQPDHQPDQLRTSCGPVADPNNKERKKERKKEDYSPEFLAWYSAYPRKEAKGYAVKAYDKAIQISTHQELVAGAQSYAKSVATKEMQYIKLPATWLNGRCWEDDTTGQQTTRPEEKPFDRGY